MFVRILNHFMASVHWTPAHAWFGFLKSSTSSVSCVSVNSAIAMSARSTKQITTSCLVWRILQDSCFAILLRLLSASCALQPCVTSYKSHYIVHCIVLQYVTLDFASLLSHYKLFSSTTFYFILPIFYRMVLHPLPTNIAQRIAAMLLKPIHIIFDRI